MAKLLREEKKKIYRKRKEGESVSSLSKKYQIAQKKIRYLVHLIDCHGEKILRKDKNRVYSKELKEEIINKVLVDGQSARSTALEYGLASDGILFNWIKSYKENNYVIVEKTKGRKPKTMAKEKETKPMIDYKSMSDEEKIKYLERRNSQLEKTNEYLKAETEYLKKLHGAIQKRKQRQKKK